MSDLIVHQFGGCFFTKPGWNLTVHPPVHRLLVERFPTCLVTCRVRNVPRQLILGRQLQFDRDIRLFRLLIKKCTLLWLVAEYMHVQARTDHGKAFFPFLPML